VSPYPKALDLSPESLRLIGRKDLVIRRATTEKQKVPVSRLGQPSQGGQLGLIVLLEAEGARSGDVGLDVAAKIRALMANVFAASFDNSASMDHLAKVASEVPIMGLARQRLSPMIAKINENL